MSYEFFTKVRQIKSMGQVCSNPPGKWLQALEQSIRWGAGGILWSDILQIVLTLAGFCNYTCHKLKRKLDTALEMRRCYTAVH